MPCRSSGAQAEFEHHGRRVLAGYLVEELEGRPGPRFEVRVREMPERRIVCLRRHVTPDELVLVGRDLLVRRMREAGVPRPATDAEAPFVIYHGLVTADSDGPVEWCRPVGEGHVERVVSLFPDLALRTDPAHQEAYVRRPLGPERPGVLAGDGGLGGLGGGARTT